MNLQDHFWKWPSDHNNFGQNYLRLGSFSWIHAGMCQSDSKCYLRCRTLSCSCINIHMQTKYGPFQKKKSLIISSLACQKEMATTITNMAMSWSPYTVSNGCEMLKKSAQKNSNFCTLWWFGRAVSFLYN